ncbi:hypothetical protein FE257_008823 [Aspergillus nanangensis]|uniref:Uncharacterized protein n=1 Tax=Aspergillus nanangensis TaxID=2582783 RepID=A0AAD4GSA4_ASPNN|nr:hypothetical protein FE257_008823 [Aspergillus nanangensis]
MQFSKIFMTLALVMATNAMTLNTLNTRQGPGPGDMCTCGTCTMDDPKTSCCDGNSYSVQCCGADTMTCSCCVGGSCGDVGCDDDINTK